MYLVLMLAHGRGENLHHGMKSLALGVLLVENLKNVVFIPGACNATLAILSSSSRDISSMSSSSKAGR